MSVVEYEKKDRIAYVTINRPEAMNALNTEVRQGLADSWEKVDGDPEVLVAIVAGAGGKAFSSGADLKTSETGVVHADEGIIPDSRRAPKGPSARHVSKPVIAAIDGYCLAGGLELALACDIRIASEDSQFGCPEVKWSLHHGFGALVMPSTVHMSNVMELLFTGEFIDAKEAYRIGLISRVVPKDKIYSTATEIAEKICMNAPLAVRVTKELARRWVERGLEEDLRLYATLDRLVKTTDDFAAGPPAFAEKRRAVFKGR